MVAVSPLPVPSWLLLLVLLLSFSCERIQAWTWSTRPLSQKRCRPVVVATAAKPPPAAQFDLEAIEAFEAQLDQQQEQAQQFMDDTIDNEEIDDDDDDDEQSPDDKVLRFTIDDTLDGKRIDAALAAAFKDLSRSACGSLVTNQQVYLIINDNNSDNENRKQVVDRKSFKVQTGQVLEIHTSTLRPEVTEIFPQDIALDILFEDEHMIVINKAAHMVVHPAAGNWDGTIVNALAYYLANGSPYGQGDFLNQTTTTTTTKASENIAVEGTDGESVNFRPGVVHRLDKGTTGVLVLAKTAAALSALSASFAQRQVKKTYLAVTVGNPGRRVVIDKPVGRHPIHRQRMRVVPNPHKHGVFPESAVANNAMTATSTSGRRALSYVDTLAFDGRLSLVKVRIETGRTHQIRVHLADRRTPIYGDDVYGLPDWNKKLKQQHGTERPLLHAYRLEINHPVSGQSMVFEAPLAEDMLRLGRAICGPQADDPSFLQMPPS